MFWNTTEGIPYSAVWPGQFPDTLSYLDGAG
jgi:hypothetical protein